MKTRRKRPMELKKVIIACIVILSLATFFKLVYDDIDPGFDTLCVNDVLSSHDWLALNAISIKSSLYELNLSIQYPEPLISFLARQEKSPPIV